MLNIRDISDKGLKNRKGLRYEVGVSHSELDDTPEIVAKFKAYGDAYAFACHIAAGNVFYFEVIIRS